MIRLRSVVSLVQRLPGVAAMSDSTKSVDTTYMEIPLYNIEKPQSLDQRKARLLYQSRKRGMLENDLILSTFAHKYLAGFSEEQTIMYDRLINSPTNDWDIFHWVVKKIPTPKEFDNEIMAMLQKHAENSDKIALKQPDLY